MKKAIFLYNPRAGKGRIARSAGAICAALREGGYEAEPRTIDFAKNPFDGNETIDLMVVAGGDGTVNFTLNSMKRKGLDIPVGIIPAGTANDFAGAVGMSRDPLRAARQIASGTPRRVDCGRVNDLWFVNIFSFGLFTTTSQRTPDERKHRIGKLAYLLEGAKELRSMHGIPLEVEADGRKFRVDALMTLIFNGETAGGFRLARESSVRDGLFDCLLLEKRNLFVSVFAMLRYLLGGKPAAVRHLRARELRILSPLDELTDVDGQRGERFPLHVVCHAGGFCVVHPGE